MESYIISGCPAVVQRMDVWDVWRRSRYPVAMKRAPIGVWLIVGLVTFACGGGDEQTDSNSVEEQGSDEGDPTDASEDATDTATPAPDGQSAAATDAESSSGDLSSSLDEALGVDDTVMSEDLAMTPASVGQACESDDDCGDGVVCLIEDEQLQPGQIAGGMCTIRCEQDPDVCGSTALCLGVGQDTEDVADDVGYCYELCIFAGANVKCQDSLNRTCTLIDPETALGVCDPKCFSDGECADGLSCAPRYPWTCVDDLPDDLLPDGATCTLNEECAGGGCLFMEETSTDGICLSDCSLQVETFACGRDIGDTTPVDSACFPLLAVIDAGIPAAENDLGQCLPTCDPDEGCEHPEWTCIDLMDEGYTADVGHAGVCFPLLLIPDDAEVTDTGMGGAPGADEEVVDAGVIEEEPMDSIDDMGTGGGSAVDAGAN